MINKNKADYQREMDEWASYVREAAGWASAYDAAKGCARVAAAAKRAGFDIVNPYPIKIGGQANDG